MLPRHPLCLRHRRRNHLHRFRQQRRRSYTRTTRQEQKWDSTSQLEREARQRYEPNRSLPEEQDGVPVRELGHQQVRRKAAWEGTTVTVPPRTAVDEWVKEKKFYNHTTNSCESNHECGVYTQVVWRNSVEVGCSQATCLKEKASLTICFYDPPGNVIGESPY